MFVVVDNDDMGGEVEGFEYTSSSGRREQVAILDAELVEFRDGNQDAFRIYVDDIPKAIKALKAAHEHLRRK